MEAILRLIDAEVEAARAALDEAREAFEAAVLPQLETIRRLRAARASLIEAIPPDEVELEAAFRWYEQHGSVSGVSVKLPGRGGDERAEPSDRVELTPSGAVGVTGVRTEQPAPATPKRKAAPMPSKAELARRQRAVLHAISVGHDQGPAVQRVTGLPAHVVKAAVARLIAEGKVERVGARNRHGRWRVVASGAADPAPAVVDASQNAGGEARRLLAHGINGVVGRDLAADFGQYVIECLAKVDEPVNRVRLDQAMKRRGVPLRDDVMSAVLTHLEGAHRIQHVDGAYRLIPQ